MKRLIIILILLALARAAQAQQKTNLTAASASCTSTSCLSVSVDPGQGGATFTITANASGNTIQFEASGDGGTTRVALNVTPSNSTTAVTSTTGTGTWQANTAGYTNVYMRMSTLSGGSTTVSIVQSIASARAGGGGGGAGTTINATNNVLPKRSNATTFVDSALSDNATNVTTTEAVLGPNGTGALPTYAFTSAPSVGMNTDGTNLLLNAGGSNGLVVGAAFVKSNLSFQYAAALVNSVTGAPLVYTTAPTIVGGGCGGSAATISAQNGTAAFKIAVGTAPGSACTVTMPASVTGWNCSASDITTQTTSVSLQRQTGAESTTSVTITNFSDVTVPTSFVANDVLKVICFAD